MILLQTTEVSIGKSRKTTYVHIVLQVCKFHDLGKRMPRNAMDIVIITLTTPASQDLYDFYHFTGNTLS